MKKSFVLPTLFLLLSISSLFAQTFLPLPDPFYSDNKLTLHGYGYLTPAILSEDEFDPSIKLTLSYQPFKHFLSFVGHSRGPGFQKYRAESITTSSIIFPEKNASTYQLHFSTPFILREKEVAQRFHRIKTAPFYEVYLVSPWASDVNAFSLSGDRLGYESTSFYIGETLTLEYYPKAFRYSLHGSVFYYRVNVHDKSIESFRNIFGDPYLPTAFRGFGAKLAAQMNDFSISVEVKQNINLVESASHGATVNQQANISRLEELEGVHLNLKLRWSGKLLSF